MKIVKSVKKNFALLLAMVILTSVLTSLCIINTALAGSPTISRVQEPVTGHGGTGATSVGVTLSQTPVSGNVLIAAIGTASIASVSSISETGVNWSRVSNSSANNLEIWQGIVGAGASTTITATLNQSTSYPTIEVVEYTGISGVIDNVTSNSGTSTTATTGTISATTYPNELWFGATYVSSTVGVTQSSPINSFSLLDGAPYNNPPGGVIYTTMGLLENIVSSTGSAESGVHLDYSATWKSVLVAFKGITAPTYSGLSVSSIVANSSAVFSAAFNDATALNSNGQYQFGTNNTGSWVWDSAVNFTSTPQTPTVTKTLSNTVGATISYMWNFTNNAGLSNSTGIQTLTTTTGPFDHIYCSISPTSITAGSTANGTATAYDVYNHSLGIVTAVWSISSGASGNWISNNYTSRYSGVWTVTASYSGKTATCQLTVNNGALASISIAPLTATVTSGQTQSFVATALDTVGNNLGTVTSSTTWSIDAGAGGSWVQSTGTYTSDNAGVWTVTASYNATSATARLQVFPAGVSTPTPTPIPVTPTPAATIPPNRPTQTLILYFRSDTYSTCGIASYGLDTDYTNSAITIPITASGATNITYGIRVFVVTSANRITELTTGSPVALLTLSSNFTGVVSSIWDCPETNTILGYQALRVDVYVSTDSGASWTVQLSTLSSVLITNKIVASAWSFNLNVNYTQTTDTYCSFTFGNTNFRSGVSNVVIETPLESEIQLWRINRGDVVGFEIGAYFDIIGEGFYALLLLLFAGVLYFRYGHFGTVAFFFVLFGGVGGLAWILVPVWAAAVLSALVILGTSFIVWRVIR